MVKRNKSLGMIFIHGAGLGRWIWRPVISRLTIPTLAVDLPAREAPQQARAGLRLRDYSEYVLKQVSTFQVDSVIVVAHSLGGVVGLEVAYKLGKKLAGFVGVTAAIPARRGSFISCLPVPQRWLLGVIVLLSGTRPPQSAIKRSLCSDLNKKQTDEIIARFTPESKSVYFDHVICTLPLTVPTLYIKTTRDKEFGTALLATMAKNLHADKIVEIDSGHMPMLSHPDKLAAALNTFVANLEQDNHI